MTLGNKQQLFTKLLADLIRHIYEMGYEAVLEEAKRSNEQSEINALGAEGRGRLVVLLRNHAEFAQLADNIADNVGSGIRNSVHQLKLAVDISLFKDGKYLQNSEAYEAIGEFWESLHDLCRWGGRFKHPDGNHFSFEHEGAA